MGTLQHFYLSAVNDDLQYEIADYQYPYSDSPFDNPPLVPKPTFVNGHDIADLKANILSAHALGVLPTRKLFESIAAQNEKSLTIEQKAARYAQEFIDTLGYGLSAEELDQIDFKSVYREEMQKFIHTATIAQNTLPLFPEVEKYEEIVEYA